jgi:hypothetical protein
MARASADATRRVRLDDPGLRVGAAPQRPRHRPLPRCTDCQSCSPERVKTHAAPSARPISPVLQRLAQSVRTLEDAAGDAAHHQLTRALRDAENALDELEPNVAADDAALRTGAARIESSGPLSNNHADELRPHSSRFEQLLSRARRRGVLGGGPRRAFCRPCTGGPLGSGRVGTGAPTSWRSEERIFPTSGS